MPAPAPIAIAAALLLAAPAAAMAASVRVEVMGVRSDDGRVLVALCPAELFLTRDCDVRAAAPASPGRTDVVVRDVPPGIYAVQVIHDENGNADLDRSLLGLPVEGFGFSRDAPVRGLPPRFADAAVEVTERGGRLALRMRYW